jgi:hypothetical protein
MASCSFGVRLSRPGQVDRLADSAIFYIARNAAPLHRVFQEAQPLPQRMDRGQFHRFDERQLQEVGLANSVPSSNRA